MSVTILKDRWVNQGHMTLRPAYSVPRSYGSGTKKTDAGTTLIVHITQAVFSLKLETAMFIYVTQLHKTSHKSPNIKWQKISFYLKISKSVIFLFSSKQQLLGKALSKYLFFYIILLIFLKSIFGYFKRSFK